MMTLTWNKRLLLLVVLGGCSMTYAMQQQPIDFYSNPKATIWHYQVDNLNPAAVRPTQRQIKRALAKRRDLYSDFPAMEGSRSNKIRWKARKGSPSDYHMVVLCNGALAQEKSVLAKQSTAFDGVLGGVVIGAGIAGPLGAVIGGILGGIAGYLVG